MRLFAVLPMTSGAPAIDAEVYPYYGFVLCDESDGYGAYLLSGTAAQMEAIGALDEVYAIAFVTESDEEKWPELDEVVKPQVRAKLNRFLAPLGWPIIPAQQMARQAVERVFSRFNADFVLNGMWIVEPAGE